MLLSHEGAVTSKALMQGVEHYQPQGPLQPPQLHQGAAAGVRHSMAVGSDSAGGLPPAGQVSMLPARGAGQYILQGLPAFACKGNSSTCSALIDGHKGCIS